MSRLNLEIGKFYRTRDGKTVQIVKAIEETEPCYLNGFRFRDQDNNSYKPNGHWSFDGKKRLGQDIIEEMAG